MSQLLSRPLAWLLVAILILPGLISPIAQLPDSSPPPASQANAETPLWNVWGADQYALADDGASIWIGAVGGVVQWDKQTGTYRRYTRLDGLPHTQVLAIAVDASGNRWFGGDGGLSRLDAAGNLTHFQSTNSGLHSNYVDGIAVVGGDTLYVSHGLPGGSVDRRDSDGSWRWYPNRETAIQADYATIVQTRGSSTLWTVAGSEVWAGTSVYQRRALAQARTALYMGGGPQLGRRQSRPRVGAVFRLLRFRMGRRSPGQSIPCPLASPARSLLWPLIKLTTFGWACRSGGRTPIPMSTRP